MGGSRGTYRVEKRCIENFVWENRGKRDHLEDSDLDLEDNIGVDL